MRKTNSSIVVQCLRSACPPPTYLFICWKKEGGSEEEGDGKENWVSHVLQALGEIQERETRRLLMGLVRPHFPGCFFNVWAYGQVVPKLFAECPGITGQAALLVPWPVNPCLLACSAPRAFAGGSVTCSPTPACSKACDLLTAWGSNPSSGPTPAPSHGQWPGLWHLPYCCCLMLSVPRLDLSLSPLLALCMVPSGWNSSLWLLLLRLCFLEACLWTQTGRAVVTVDSTPKRSWWREAVLNPQPVHDNYLLCV